MLVFLAAVVALAGLTPAASADPQGSAELTSLPLEVRSVITGGYWEAGDEHGIYRVIVIERGWERVSCIARAEWIAERSDTGTREIVSTVDLEEIQADTWSLGIPALEFVPETSTTLLSIPASSSYSGGDSTFCFELGPPGSYREMETAER